VCLLRLQDRDAGRRPLLGDSLATPKVPRDCLKVGLDFVSTDFQAVARHFGRLERMA